MGCKILNNTKGFTLVEVLVGAGIFMIVFFGVIIGSTQIVKMTHNTATLNTSDNMVDSIIENIRQSFSSQIITIDKDSAWVGTLNETEKLPMAWSLYEDVPVSECPKCPGRYGYTLQSMGSYSGLYIVTVQFTHTDWIAPRKYEFIVSR